MTMTHDPIPAPLAMPGGEEPIPDEALDRFAAEALELAADCGLAPAEAAIQIRESWEAAHAAAIAGQEAEEGEPVPLPERPAIQRFEITDDGLAEWAMRKLAAIEAEEREVAERAEGWIEEIRAWKAERDRPLAARRAFFEGALTAYLRRLREESGEKIKSRKLPSGTIKSTGSKPKVAVADDEAIADFLREHLEVEELREIVRSKVLVGELRKIAVVSEKPVGERLTVGLGCEHDLSIWIPAEGEKPIRPSVGEEVACPSCEAEFGEQPLREVVSIETETITEPVARDEESGFEIPGTIIEPESVSFSVKVGG